MSDRNAKRADGEQPDGEHLEGEHPVAEVRPGSWFAVFRKQAGWWWIISAGCLILAGALTTASWVNGGREITIEFQQGHGLKPGDALQHRGIEVGEVAKVELAPDLSSVRVDVLLQSNAKHLAREGSEFWIERPQVSLTRVRGLDTVVGAKHLSVSPGPPDAPAANRFVGLESPRVLDDVDGGEVLVHFRQGGGLTTGDVLKHRGIVVGEVTAVDLNEQLEGVDVRIRLRSSARGLAREGSEFWIVRPRLSISEVRGLETVVGGLYVAVNPAPADAALNNQFAGLEEPPANIERQEGGLEITLFSKHRYGVQPGAPVTFRGLTIGRVVDVGLATDAVEVLSRVYIEPAYRQLVREQSRFWSTSGVGVQIGVTGVRLDYETLATIAAGGVSMSTPRNAGSAARTGQRFELAEEADREWLTFDASIPIGSALLPAGAPLPTVLRASLNWSASRLGIGRTRQRAGWVMPLAGNRLLGPSELLAPHDPTDDGGFSLEVEGKRFPLALEKAEQHGQIAVYALPDALPKPERLWSLDRVRVASTPEDCLLIPAAPTNPALPVAAARLQPLDGRWLIESTQTLDERWHGVPVVATRDGALVGLLLVEKGQGVVALLPAEWK